MIVVKNHVPIPTNELGTSTTKIPQPDPSVSSSEEVDSPLKEASTDTSKVDVSTKEVSTKEVSTKDDPEKTETPKDKISKQESPKDKILETGESRR